MGNIVRYAYYGARTHVTMGNIVRYAYYGARTHVTAFRVSGHYVLHR